MSLEQTIKDTVMAEQVDLDMRLQQLVRAGLMPSNTIPLLRKAITKIQGGYPLQGAERDVMANFLNSMMFIVLGDDTIFNKARVGAKSYATEAKDESEYGYEGDMAISQLKSISRHAEHFMGMLKPDTDLPEWVQSKITLAADYISTAHDYMMSEVNESKDGMPFEGPYRKSGERKDEYGNKVKNVAKHLAKKAMNKQKNEEIEQIDEVLPLIAGAAARYVAGRAGAGVVGRTVAGAATKYAVSKSMNKEDVEEIEEKRGLWDNIHAKRKRIKAGSDERMRKPGSEGAPSAADLKNSRTEEVDLEEATYFVHTANKAHHVNKKIPTGKKDAMGQALMTSKVVKSFPYGDTQSKQTSPDQHKAAHAHAKKLNAGMKEEVETIDELSKGKLQSYMDKAKTKPGEVVANANDPASMRKYGNRLNSRIRAGRKILAKESRRGEALADIAAITQMNESYKTTFDAALTQYGIKSPSELDEEKRKQFFNFVDQEYKKGDN